MGVDDRDGAFDPADSCDATTGARESCKLQIIEFGVFGRWSNARSENIPGVTQNEDEVGRTEENRFGPEPEFHPQV